MITNLITNPTIYNITQTTQAQVGIETGLKAIGRPGFILLDNNISSNTKKYSATKEFLYQMTCLVASIAVIIPVFKKNSFAIARKLLKDEPIFKVFKNSSEFNSFYNKNSKDVHVSKLREKYLKSGFQYPDEDLQNHIHLAKGLIEVSSIVGSILGLSIVAPMISRPMIRPLLKRFGLGKKDEKNKEPAKINVRV